MKMKIKGGAFFLKVQKEQDKIWKRIELSNNKLKENIGSEGFITGF